MNFEINPYKWIKELKKIKYVYYVVDHKLKCIKTRDLSKAFETLIRLHKTLYVIDICDKEVEIDYLF